MALSFLSSGVPVKPKTQAFGSIWSIFSRPMPPCVRWASSTSTKILGSGSTYRGFFISANLWTSVVTTPALFCSINSLRCSADFACTTSFLILQAAKVSRIWSSNWVRSVTTITRGLPTSSIRFFTSITIVKLLPDPCVCQISPPWRLPFSKGFTRSNVRLMA